MINLFVIITYLRSLIVGGSELSPLDKYILVRDLTFFVVDFYTGDRAFDLGRLQVDQVFRLKDREGFLLNFTFGKTIRAGLSPPLCSVVYSECACLSGFVVELLYCGL